MKITQQSASGEHDLQLGPRRLQEIFTVIAAGLEMGQGLPFANQAGDNPGCSYPFDDSMSTNQYPLARPWLLNWGYDFSSRWSPLSVFDPAVGEISPKSPGKVAIGISRLGSLGSRLHLWNSPLDISWQLISSSKPSRCFQTGLLSGKHGLVANPPSLSMIFPSNKRRFFIWEFRIANHVQWHRQVLIYIYICWTKLPWYPHFYPHITWYPHFIPIGP